MSPDAGAGRGIVVVGASAGGVEALTRLVRRLPADFPGAILVVLHVPPSGSVLPGILSRAGELHAHHAVDGELLEGSRIYVAAPDAHLLLEADAVRVVPGPRENGHRPAIDPLFRTAATNHGAGVVGVILSGSLDDGAAGLQAVKRAGGLTVVQAPDEALYDAMPLAAIEAADPDHVLPVVEIAELLLQVVDGSPPPLTGARMEETMNMTPEPDPTQLDTLGLAEKNATTGEVTAFTCPECNGTLWEVKDGDVVKLRCRVGHTFTEDGYDREKSLALEAALWNAMTALIEKADFSSRLTARFRRTGHELTASRYEEQAVQCLEQAERIRLALGELTGTAVVDEAAAQAS